MCFKCNKSLAMDKQRAMGLSKEGRCVLQAAG